MLMTTPADYATFMLEFLGRSPATDFRLTEKSRQEMLRPQVKTQAHREGLAWAIEQHEGAPPIFAHSGQDVGYYCVAAGCVERRSAVVVMMNGDAWAPFLMKLLANPAGPQLAPQMIWPDFVRRFFGM